MNDNNISYKFATILWFGVTAALLGFATIYIFLKLAGNMISSPKPQKTVSAVSNQPDKSKTAKSPKTVPLNMASPTKEGSDPANIQHLGNQTTQIAKHSAPLPVNIASKNSPQNSLSGLNKGEMSPFLVRSSPIDVPSFKFINPEKQSLTLESWKGKVVLLNIWATWCAPCRKEMPDLDKLKATLGNQPFDVVTVNIDNGGLKKPARFFKKLGIKNLALYGASTARLTTLLKAPGLPATILIGKNGKELGRLIGPAHWASPEAIALIQAALKIN